MTFRVVSIGVVLFATLALAQPRPGGGGGGAPRPPQPPQQPAVLKSYVETHSTRLEVELATFIQKRAETAQADASYLEMQIDLRILQRWLIRQIIEPDPYSDAQAVMWLRHRDLNDLIATVDAWSTAQRGVLPTRQQQEAMAAIRKVTFDMKPAEQVAALDALLGSLRSPLLAAIADKTAKAPEMRPVIKKVAAPADPASHTEPAEPPTVDQLSTRITQLTITIPLRQQLLSAVAATKSAEGEEKQLMLEMLRAAVDLAGALQSNLGVDASTRPQIEANLGEAVSLYSDSRLREAGEKRLKALAQYRQLAGRVSSLALPPEIVRALAPAFAYARENPNESAKVLGAIDAFAQIESQLPTIRPPAGIELLGRQIEAQFKQLLNQRAGFMEDAEKLKGTGMFVTSPDDLVKRIDAMKQPIAMIDVLKRQPQTMATLLELKPRPTGSLERRTTQSLVKMVDDEAAQSFVQNLDLLATTWTSAQKSLANKMDEAMVTKYAGSTWGAFETRVRGVVTDAVNGAAATGTIDAAKLESLQRLLGMIERLRTLAALDAKLTVDAAVNRWADCSLDNDKLAKLLDSYRNDFAAIVNATLQGGGDEKEAVRLAKRYQGLLNTLDRVAESADQCQQLPSGPVGQIARFATPSDKAPFGHVRYLSFATDLIELTRMSADADVETINKMQDQMLDRLNKR